MNAIIIAIEPITSQLATIDGAGWVQLVSTLVISVLGARAIAGRRRP